MTDRVHALMDPPTRDAPVEDEPEPEAACGVVESLNGKEVIGWVHVPEGTGPVRVGLYLGDLEVDHVEPAALVRRTTVGKVRGFRFRLREVWKYCGPGDQLSVRLDGARLPMTGRGMYYRPRNQGVLPKAELEAKLADGWVIASNGRLNKSRADDLEWQDAVLGLYGRVRIALKEITGYDAFYIYGSLLGAVREGTFIGHDFDFDAAYLSRHREPAKAGAELGEIAIALIERGFQVDSRSTCLHVHDDLAGQERIDLFHIFFDLPGTMQFPWGVAGTRPFTFDQWEGVEDIDFAGTTATVPRNAEALVETIYGATWRIPNPGFDWARDRTTQVDGAIVPRMTNAWINWQDFWLRHHFDQPSSFAAALLQRPDLPATVFDLGCGDGRDTFAFAQTGRVTTGLEWSPAAVDSADRRAVQTPEDQRPTFVLCDLDQSDALRARLTDGRPDGPALFYARFLLHAIYEGVELNLLSLLGEVLRPGDLLALEFRGEADARLFKNRPPAFRRFVNAATLVRRLTRLGFTVITSEEGTGLAPYEKEDPYVHRIVAERGIGAPRAVDEEDLEPSSEAT